MREFDRDRSYPMEKIETLYRDIQNFYDASSTLWESIWGEHMHHGYYGAEGRDRKERRQAQIDLIEELLKWAAIERAENILDVGCGIGGSTLYLAKKFEYLAEKCDTRTVFPAGSCATGISLSPVQVKRARERAKDAGLAERCRFEVANAMAIPFLESSFDLVWSLESGEHMPDKQQFLQECYRMLRPGGTFLLVTWCHRPIQNAPLTESERRHLEAIYRVYCLPGVISLPEYEAIARDIGFQAIRTADWSQAVAPFWNEVIGSAVRPGAIAGLLRCGWKTVRAALSLRLMRQGYRRGLVRFGLLRATKS